MRGLDGTLPKMLGQLSMLRAHCQLIQMSVQAQLTGFINPAPTRFTTDAFKVCDLPHVEV